MWNREEWNNNKNRSQDETPHPNNDEFRKFSFLVRHCDLTFDSSFDDVPCIWSIENHVMIVKWIPTDVPGQFQITNRYNLWNGCETDRYIHLDISDAEIREARHSGVITIDLDLISTEGFD